MNENLCIDFLPMLDAENPDASFMRESIDMYCAVANAEAIDESIKTAAADLAKKLKKGAKAVWKAVSGVAAKVKKSISDVTEHFRTKKKKSQNESADSLDEGITQVFGYADKVKSSSGWDLVNGFDIACSVILRNIEMYECIVDAADKAFDRFLKGDDPKTVLADYRKEYDAGVDKSESARVSLGKKYKIPVYSKDGTKISQLAYASQLIGDPAEKHGVNDQKVMNAFGDIIQQKWNKIIPKFNKVYEAAIQNDCRLFVKYQKVKEKLTMDRIGYAAPMVQHLADIGHDIDYTYSDIMYLADRMNKTLTIMNAKVVKESSEAMDETISNRNVFYRLSDSTTYRFARQISQTNGASLESGITRMVRKGQGFNHLGLADLDKTVLYELFESNQFFNVNVSGAKKAMRGLLASGKVQMVYSDIYKIAPSIPFVITVGERPRVFVNISDFVSPNEYGKYVVGQARNLNGLMAILFAACVAYAILTHYHVLNPEVGDPIVLMHSYMLSSVLDRMVHMDPLMKDKIRYLCTEFALIQMYGTEKGNKLFQRFRQKYFPKMSPMIMNSVDAQFPLDSFDNLDTMINTMVQIYPSMKNVTYRGVWIAWNKRYGAATALSIDYIGYHIYTLSMLLYESPLVNRLALDPMLKSARGEGALRSLQMMIASVG